MQEASDSPSPSESPSPTPSPVPPSSRPQSASQAASSRTPASPPASSDASELSRHEALSLLRSRVKSELVEVEFHARKKKLERVDNAIRNATKTGGPKVHGYSYADEAERLRRDIEATLTRKTRDKRKPLHLTEPAQPITHLLHRCSAGRLSALAYLRAEGGLAKVIALTPTVVWASLTCYRDVVKSPLNFKLECLWRLAVVGEEWLDAWGDAQVMWKISAAVYGMLLDRCDPRDAPWQYSALRAGLERVHEALEQWEMQRQIDQPNRAIVFTPPNFDDGQAMFFFQT